MKNSNTNIVSLKVFLNYTKNYWWFLTYESVLCNGILPGEMISAYVLILPKISKALFNDILPQIFSWKAISAHFDEKRVFCLFWQKSNTFSVFSSVEKYIFEVILKDTKENFSIVNLACWFCTSLFQLTWLSTVLTTSRGIELCAVQEKLIVHQTMTLIFF